MNMVAAAELSPSIIINLPAQQVWRSTPAFLSAMRHHERNTERLRAYADRRTAEIAADRMTDEDYAKRYQAGIEAQAAMRFYQSCLSHVRKNAEPTKKDKKSCASRKNTDKPSRKPRRTTSRKSTTKSASAH